MSVEEWKWVDCPMVIQKTVGKQTKGQSFIFESLKPALYFEDDQGTEHQLVLQIGMERQFQYEQENGFVWHKNCIIPEIKISINAEQYHQIKQSPSIGTVHCELTSAYTVRQSDYYLCCVPLEGQSTRPFKDRTVRFSNLKFTQTSFNLQKNKFSLIIWIYVQNKDGDRNTLKAYISSQIHVDSRKEARKRPSSKPDLTEKICFSKFTQDLFMRVNNKRKKIDNSLEGFFDFYGAANIRNKIKHPFYLGYHFNNLFFLYYNKMESKNPMEVLKKITNAQKHNAKIILLSCKAQSSMRKKILSLFDNWRFNFVIVSLEEDSVHCQEKWQIIPYQHILDHYKKYATQEYFQPKILKEPPKQITSNDKKRDNQVEYQIHQQISLQFGTRKKVKMESITKVTEESLCN